MKLLSWSIWFRRVQDMNWPCPICVGAFKIWTIVDENYLRNQAVDLSWQLLESFGRCWHSVKIMEANVSYFNRSLASWSKDWLAFGQIKCYCKNHIHLKRQTLLVRRQTSNIRGQHTYDSCNREMVDPTAIRLYKTVGANCWLDATSIWIWFQLLHEYDSKNKAIVNDWIYSNR